MGRRKIVISRIADQRNRSVTFLKRKNGLMKKAFELGVLCQADIVVLVFNDTGKLFEFGSGNIDQTISRRANYHGDRERRGPRDFAEFPGANARRDNGQGGKMTAAGSGDEDGEEEEEEEIDEGETSDYAENTRSRVHTRTNSLSTQMARSKVLDSASPPMTRTNSNQPNPGGQLPPFHLSPFPPQHNPYAVPGNSKFPPSFPLTSSGPDRSQLQHHHDQQQLQQQQLLQQQQNWAYSQASSAPAHLRNILHQEILPQSQPGQSPGNWAYAPPATQYNSYNGAGGFAVNHLQPPNGHYSSGAVTSTSTSSFVPPDLYNAAPNRQQYRDRSSSAYSVADPARPQSRAAIDEEVMLSGATSPAGSSERCASRDGRNNPRPLLNVSIPQDHAAQLVIDLAARAENERDGIAQQIVEEVNSEQELDSAVSRNAASVLPSPSGFLKDLCYSGGGYGLSAFPGLSAVLGPGASEGTVDRGFSSFSWPKSAVSPTGLDLLSGASPGGGVSLTEGVDMLKRGLKRMTSIDSPVTATAREAHLGDSQTNGEGKLLGNVAKTRQKTALCEEVSSS